ncbi:DUF6596 domain-containing protein [Dactylosporangium sp. AC04546]|uniref:RNA polymerase sigma factor n=1 Tax=Dactylosporangium sp. AC04546 TaxID=2862460 RepID=UPI002E7AAFD2|nr:DUF6596 domain-containing protein [Dactylosporangium sp. AC04546]WVK88613.1 DUF6596 domain-containing protein [Dactylosporangium sp. AC04546]
MTVEEHLRTLAAPALGALTRRYGDFARCEDAVQEALLAAAGSWPRTGVPDHPLGWLITAATRRYVDQLRADTARERRERAAHDALPRDALVAPPPDAEPARDDVLDLLFLCCHPALAPSAQIALTLRAVGGLTTTEIAAAFLVPDKTMGQRISRAKQRLREAGVRFDRPAPLSVVLHVLYLIFNEGYTQMHRTDLTREAVRLARELHERRPDSAEAAGLLALMLLTEARRATRTGPDGVLVPLDEQDRSLWDRAAIAEGTALLTGALATGRPGPYQVQAAIAALHDEAPSVEATDWPQILLLYRTLDRLAPNPVATLNRAVALGMVNGPQAGLDLLAELESGELAGYPRLPAVRAHLLERSGDRAGAAAAYQEAARLAASRPEQRFLLRRAAHCRNTEAGSDTSDERPR